MDSLERLREVAEAVALNQSMETRHGETADLAHDEIRRLRQDNAQLQYALEKSEAAPLTPNAEIAGS